jgi:cytochrome oxidase Cu insertion factor (SCO1/SenC/PrrC family)
VVTGFKVAARPPRSPSGAPAPGGTELTHTTRIVLIDPQGQVRGYLDGQEATADDLVSAVRTVVR